MSSAIHCHCIELSQHQEFPVKFVLFLSKTEIYKYANILEAYCPSSLGEGDLKQPMVVQGEWVACRHIWVSVAAVSVRARENFLFQGKKQQWFPFWFKFSTLFCFVFENLIRHDWVVAVFIERVSKQGVIACACNSSTWDTEAEGLQWAFGSLGSIMNSRSALAIEWDLNSNKKTTKNPLRLSKML